MNNITNIKIHYGARWHLLCSNEKLKLKVKYYYCKWSTTAEWLCATFNCLLTIILLVVASFRCFCDATSHENRCLCVYIAAVAALPLHSTPPNCERCKKTDRQTYDVLHCHVNFIFLSYYDDDSCYVHRVCAVHSVLLCMFIFKPAYWKWFFGCHCPPFTFFGLSFCFFLCCCLFLLSLLCCRPLSSPRTQHI